MEVTLRPENESENKRRGVERRHSLTFADEFGEALEEDHPLETSYYRHQQHHDMQLGLDDDDEEEHTIEIIPVHLYGTVAVMSMSEEHPDYRQVSSQVFEHDSELKFIPKRVKQLGLRGSTLIWKLTSKLGPAALAEKLQRHTTLSSWAIELLPPKPLNFIATVPNIVNLARQLRSMGREYQDHLFCPAPMTVAQLEAEYDRARDAHELVY